jgi:hypothetical protein
VGSARAQEAAPARPPADSSIAAQEILAAHPLFESLSTKHAASMMPAGDGSSASSLGSDTINVTIHSLSAASCTAEPMSKRLPASLQIGRLKQMCKRVFKLDIDLQVRSGGERREHKEEGFDDDM